jgi:hypothetical protein
MNVPNLIQPDYQAFIAELKERIQTPQIKDAADNPTIESLEREVEAVTLLHENEGERP